MTISQVINTIGQLEESIVKIEEAKNLLENDLYDKILNSELEITYKFSIWKALCSKNELSIDEIAECEWLYNLALSIYDSDIELDVDYAITYAIQNELDYKQDLIDLNFATLIK